MFRRVSWPLYAFVLVAALITSACGDPPTREMDQAQGAIDAARAAGADRYAAESYQAAVEALKSAEQAVTDRDYRLALNHAIDSRERAQDAAKEAADRQVTLRADAERRLSEVTALLVQANQRAAAAEAAKAPRKALTDARSAIDSADAALQEASAEINGGDYQASQKRLSDIAVQVRTVISELDGLGRPRAAKPRR